MGLILLTLICIGTYLLFSLSVIYYRVYYVLYLLILFGKT